jgi:hypothetical protein
VQRSLGEIGLTPKWFDGEKKKKVTEKCWWMDCRQEQWEEKETNFGYM